MNSYFDSPSVRTAIAEVEANKVGLIALQGEDVVYTSATPGIRGALELHDCYPALLRGAVIVDRIIGRAAAMIFADGGALAIYGSVMNRKAQQELSEKGVPTCAGTLVEQIINRTGDGICPMEQTILGITDPKEGLPRLRAKVQSLLEKQKEASR